MCISTGNFVHFFLGVMPFLKIEYGQNETFTTETVCQFNSSETAQQNFLKLCNNEGHNV